MRKFFIFILLVFISNSAKIEKRMLEKMKLFYKDLPVLVTGGAGFIGSHITEKLVALGAKVTVIDNLSSGNLQNLENILYKINFINKNIEDFEACLQVTKGQAVIFHLAAFISVPDSIKNPILCHKTNVDGTFNILEAARLNNVERLVLSSSAAVYGNREGICKENMLCDPQSPYGTSKRIGELLFKQYADNFGLKTVVLRYFNVFGNRQNPNGAYAAVVAKFTDLMKKDLPVTIFGDGLQTRDFIPVETVVEANLILAMLKDIQMNGQIFNVATGKSINLFELIDTLKKDFPQYDKEIIFKPTRPGDIKHSIADTTKYLNLGSL